LYKDKIINKPKERVIRERKPADPNGKKRGRKPKVKVSSDSDEDKEQRDTLSE
jgi:hypothetical protein